MITNSAAAQLAANSFGIKITSPTRGQQIPINTSSLIINGFSSHSDLLHCNVFVIVNGIKPYHKAVDGISTNKSSNYSTWVYYLVPSYTSIKIGANKVTSKLACQSNNDTAANGMTTLTKFYSINFTGISVPRPNSNSTRSTVYTNEKFVQPSSQTHPTTGGAKEAMANNTKTINQHVTSPNSGNVVATKSQNGGGDHPYQLTKVNAATLLSTAGIISKNQVGTHQNNATGASLSSSSIREHRVNSNSGPASTGASVNDKSKTSNNPVDQSANNPYKPVSTIRSKSDNAKSALAMSIHFSQRVAQPGERENMTLGVTDANKTQAIAGATVSGRIVDSTGTSKKLEGVTDNKGKVRYSWLIAGNNSTNTSTSYKLIMSATAPGYQNNSIIKTLRVIPASLVSSTVHPSPIFGVHGNIINTTITPKLMPLASSNIPTATKTGLQPHQSMPLAPKQNSTYLESIKIKMNGRVHIPSGIDGISAGALPLANGKVSIPISTPQINITKVPISTPQINITKVPISVPLVNATKNTKVSVPNNPKSSITNNPLTQGVGPTQRPQLPNNNDKTPFIIATPVLHLTNDTSGTASIQREGISATLNIVDRMRFLGADSIKEGLIAKMSAPPTTADTTQKNIVFIPSSGRASPN